MSPLGVSSEGYPAYVAQQAVYQAIRRGELSRGLCEACGTTEDVCGHHDDYGRPLDVRWLCRSCHVKHHATKAKP